MADEKSGYLNEEFRHQMLNARIRHKCSAMNVQIFPE
jgi:hypothetical protein